MSLGIARPLSEAATFFCPFNFRFPENELTSTAARTTIVSDNYPSYEAHKFIKAHCYGFASFFIPLLNLTVFVDENRAPSSYGILKSSLHLQVGGEDNSP